MTASVSAERVAHTQRALGWSVERFAEEPTEMIDWPVEPGALRRWEAKRCAPPGDVVVAAEATA